MKKSRLEIRLTEDTKEELKQMAQTKGLTMTALVESLLVQAIYDDSKPVRTQSTH